MNELFDFSMMALSGILVALAYDILRAWRRASLHVLPSKKQLRRICTCTRPIGDVLWVCCAFLLFIMTIYVFADGVLRGYLIAGFLCGVLFYVGALTRVTGLLIYGLFCGFLHVWTFLFWKMPRKILLRFRKRKHA